MIGGYIGKPIGGVVGIAEVDAVGAASGVGAAASVGRMVWACDAVALGSGAAVAVGMLVPVLLRPDGDLVRGNWTDQADGTSNIFLMIDEAVASDADYVRSPSSAGGEMTLTVRLLEGGTTIAQWIHADVAVVYADAEQALTALQFAAINDFNALAIEFDDNAGNVYRFALTNPPSGVAEPVVVRYRYRRLPLARAA